MTMITVLNDKDGDYQVKIYRDRDIVNVKVLSIDQSTVHYLEKYYFSTQKAAEIYEFDFGKTDAKKVVTRFIKSK
jgi:Tol biopolymer transport system component